MIFFYNILNDLTSKYLFDIIPVLKAALTIQKLSQSRNLTEFYTRTKSFINTFFPLCIKEWNKLDAKIRNLPFASRFKKSLLIYFKTDENSIFDAHNPISIKLLNRLRLNFCCPNEHKLCHNFLIL